VYHLLHPQNAAPIATVGAPAAAAYLAAKCSCPSSVAQPWDASLFTANQPPRGPPTDPLVTPRLALPPPLDSSALPDQSESSGPPSRRCSPLRARFSQWRHTQKQLLCPTRLWPPSVLRISTPTDSTSDSPPPPLAPPPPPSLRQPAARSRPASAGDLQPRGRTRGSFTSG
jgi:hypothetical protein